MSVKKYIIPTTEGGRSLLFAVYDILEGLGMASNLKSDSTYWKVTFESPVLGEGQAVNFSMTTSTYSQMKIPSCVIQNNASYSNIKPLYVVDSYTSLPNQWYANKNMILYVDDANLWFAICMYDLINGTYGFYYFGKTAANKKIAFSCGKMNRYTNGVGNVYEASPKGCYNLDDFSVGEIKIVAEQRTIVIDSKYAQKDFYLTTESGEILKSGNSYDTIVGIKNLCKCAAPGLEEHEGFDVFKNYYFNSFEEIKERFSTAIKIDYDEVIDLTLPQED